MVAQASGKETRDKTTQPKTQQAERQPDVVAPASRQSYEMQILRLQRRIGNQAVQRMIAQGQLQPPRSTPRTLPPLKGVAQPEEVSSQDEQEAIQPASAHLSPTSAPPPDERPQSDLVAAQAPQVNASDNTPQLQRGLLSGGARWLFERAVGALGGVGQTVLGLLRRAGGAFMDIVSNPGGFLMNLITGVRQGFSQFSSNILKHLKAGFMGWLFGTVAKAGLQIPKDFSLMGIFQLVTQVIGLTVDKVKERLIKFIGQKNAARIQKAIEILTKYIGGGLGGMWELVKNKLSDLKDIVIGEVQNWVVVQVVKSAVIKIASMFNPASGIASVIMSIYNIVQWLINNGQRLAGLFQAVAGTIGSIARGSVGVVANRIEGILANAIPVAIGFFASLLGIGGIANKIAGIIRKVQQRVEDAIDAVIRKIAKQVRKLFARLRGGRGRAGNAKDEAAKKKSAATMLRQAERKYLKDGSITKESAEKVIADVKSQDRKQPVFANIAVVDGGQTWNYRYDLIQRSEEQKGGQKAPSTSSGDVDKEYKAAGTQSHAVKASSKNLPDTWTTKDGAFNKYTLPNEIDRRYAALGNDVEEAKSANDAELLGVASLSIRDYTQWLASFEKIIKELTQSESDSSLDPNRLWTKGDQEPLQRHDGEVGTKTWEVHLDRNGPHVHLNRSEATEKYINIRAYRSVGEALAHINAMDGVNLSSADQAKLTAPISRVLELWNDPNNFT